MERTIKIEYNPKRTYALQSGDGHEVGLMTSAMLAAKLASVSKIYVSPTGNDTADGLTEATAVRTLAKGFELRAAGAKDALVLMPGIHSYFASHNTYGCSVICQEGAQLIDIGTVFSGNGGNASFKWQFNTQFFYDTQLLPYLAGYSTSREGSPVWNTGRMDIPTDPAKANRLYWPVVSDGGEVRLCRLRLYYDSVNSEIRTPDPLEYEWIVSDVLGDMEVYFAAQGYPTIAFSDTSLAAALVNNVPNSVAAYTDGEGKVFVAIQTRCDLSGGTSYKNIITIWYNGVIQYWYEKDLAPSEIDYGPCNYGSATVAQPMLGNFAMFGGGGYQRYTATQPNKRMTDPGYQYSVTDSVVDNVSTRVHARVSAVYYRGVPMFSDFQGTGNCYSAKQMSDAIQAAAGVFASLPAWASTILQSSQKSLALGKGFSFGGPYNRFNSSGDLCRNVNPNSPFMTSQIMDSTNAPASSLDPVFFQAAEALADNLFYGGEVINLNFYCQMSVGALLLSPYNYTGQDLVLAVSGVGVNCRIQNCELAGTDIGSQIRAYSEGAEGELYSYARRSQDRIYAEAWFDYDQNIPKADPDDGSYFSNFIKAKKLNGYALSRKLTTEARVRNSAFVGVYILSNHVELWHVSATACAYLCIDDELVYGSCLSYFTGYYLTPDSSPVQLDYCIVREALAQNLIPPLSVVTNSMSVDPLFKSVVNPFNLRLQAVAKEDFFDSPALAYTPEVSFFGGPREAGAYDEKGTVEITWDSFDIVFPWLMQAESDRIRVSNRRRDGVRAKLSLGGNTVRLPIAWRVALSEPDLRNLELLLNADESLVRIYFNPVAKPTVLLTGYIDQAFKHGGPYGLLSKTSDMVQLDFDCQQPAGSLYDYL